MRELAPISGYQVLQPRPRISTEQVARDRQSAGQQQAGMTGCVTGGMQDGGIQTETFQGVAMLEGKVGRGGRQRPDTIY